MTDQEYREMLDEYRAKVLSPAAKSRQHGIEDRVLLVVEILAMIACLAVAFMIGRWIG
jgi:hypothetical protein